MIKSEIGHGRIYAGETQLDCTIVVEQTGPMQLTLRAGTFTHTDGRTWVLPSDVSFDLTSDVNYHTNCKIEIGDVELDGIVDVWCGSRLLDGVEEFDIPVGWKLGHLLVLPFVIPPGCTDLSSINIFTITVLPGFPDGTTMDDWKVITESVVL